MIARVLSATVIGLDAAPIIVEADINNGLPNTVIVGLPDTAVQESKERVKAAIKNSECSYPPTRVSVNLAPADVPKLGTHFDLPIALAIILASEQSVFSTEKKLFLGELSLDGSLRAVPGALAIALKSRALGIEELYVPKENVTEASLVEGIKIFGVENLNLLLKHLLGIKLIASEPVLKTAEYLTNPEPSLDMKDVAGQELAKRALEIAASGGHNILALWSQSGIPHS